MLLIFLAGIFEGSMDVIEFHYQGSLFNWLGDWWRHDPSRKYEDIRFQRDNKPKRKKWWIFIIPVWLLDGWHFLKLLLILSYIAATLFAAAIDVSWADHNLALLFCSFGGILLTCRTLGFYLAWKLF